MTRRNKGGATRAQPSTPKTEDASKDARAEEDAAKEPPQAKDTSASTVEEATQPSKAPDAPSDATSPPSTLNSDPDEEMDDEMDDEAPPSEGRLYVAEGKSITTKTGIKDGGTEVRAEDLGHDADRAEQLIKRGVLVVR